MSINKYSIFIDKKKTMHLQNVFVREAAQVRKQTIRLKKCSIMVY